MSIALLAPLFLIAWQLGRIADVLARMDRREHYKTEATP